jgi:pyrroloquinoline quinone biosynthesis protein D
VARPETSKPRLAAGCRWAEPNGPERILLYPEGALRLRGTGRDILERCDGRHTVQQIIDELHQQYQVANPARIEEEVGAFLERLQQKRIVDL